MNESVFLLVEKIPNGNDGKFTKVIIGAFSEIHEDLAKISSVADNRSLIKIPVNQLMMDGIIL